jgi:hypothetical protein
MVLPAPWFKKTIVFLNSSTDHDFLFKTVCRDSAESEIAIPINVVQTGYNRAVLKQCGPERPVILI